MKNPNGYGSVYKISGARRKKFGVRITAGWTDDGKQKYKNIGYFEKRQEAILALAEYNRDPYNIDGRNLTFAEVYEKWRAERFTEIRQTTQGGYQSAFKNSAPLHNMLFKDIRKEHLQSCLDNSGLAAATQKLLKNLHTQLFKYAIEHDIVTKNYSSLTKIKAARKPSKRSVFTPDEIAVLYENQSNKIARTVIVLLYTGMRVSELLDMEKANVDLERKIMIGGNKTAAGRNRIIPISDRILPIVSDFMQAEGDYLITSNAGGRMSYVNFLNRYWNDLMEQLGMSHKPHDTRHTFITLMDEAGVNRTVLKMIVGHNTKKDITDHYTHKNIQNLLEAANSI